MNIAKKALIFGMSYHGRAAYRLLKNNNYIILGFLENDPDTVGNKFDNVNIYPIEALSNLEYDEIIVAGRNIDDMLRQLKEEFQINQDKVKVLGRSELQLNGIALEKKENILSEMLHFVIQQLNKNNISYWMSYSSLLALFRGEEFAKFSDIDICIMSDEIFSLSENIMETSIIYNSSFSYYKSNSRYWRKGSISSITISEKIDNVVSEPAAIDIVALSKFQDCVYVPGPFGKEHCFPIDYFEGSDFISRFGLELAVPKNAEDFLCLLYGDNWVKPVERWQHKNYKSL